MPHQDDLTLSRFAAGRLPAAEAQEVRRHLDDCADCRRRATTLAGADWDAPTVTPSEHDDASQPSLARGTSVGRYLVLKLLGAGGMGQVFSAYDPELNRKVAIKLLHGREDDSQTNADDRARLQREAQAMAQLTHSNVVGVYDAGTHEGQVFVAMELVEGRTLREWLDEAPRSWREVLKVFVDAGRGLAAAHAARIVHRDFKPQNVLVGKDGRVRVTDFGLARASGTGDGEFPMPRSGLDVAAMTTSSPLVTPLTAAGVLMGTPRYMSPEQLGLEAADARSDQFSFCVALYEALYDAPPFPGVTLLEVKENIERGRVSPPPRNSKVPARLRVTLLRGLAYRSADRFPSMEALLAELERVPRVSRRRWTVAAVVAGLVVALLGVYRLSESGRGERCSAVARRLDGVWDAARKESVRKAFEATGKTYARDSWASTVSIMDAYAREWLALDVSNCEAQQRDPEADVPRQRESCLDQRFQELKALASLLAAADAKLVRGSVEAATSLDPVSRCTDARRLVSTAVASQDEAFRARAAALRLSMAEAKALEDAARYVDGLKAAESIVSSARALGFPPLLAEAMALKARLEVNGGNPQAAVEALDAADLAAEAAGMDWLRAEIAGRQVYAHYLLDELPAGIRWSRRAGALLQRLGGDDGLEAKLRGDEGFLAMEADRYSDAIANLETAAELTRKAYGPGHPRTVIALGNAAIAHSEVGHWDRAREMAQQAVALSERALGPDHPRSLSAFLLAAEAMHRVAENPQAEALATKCMDVATREYGPDHFRVGEAARLLGILALADGDPDAALARFEHEEGTCRKAFGDDSYVVGLAVGRQADALRGKGNLAEALRRAERAVAIAEKSKVRRLAVADPLTVLGHVLLDSGRPAQAVPRFQRAIAVVEAALGPDSILLANPLTGLGEALVATSDYAGARKALERAIKLREGHRFRREDDGRTRFALAKAIWESKGDRGQALDLARQARTGFAAAPAGARKDLARVEAWLAVHKDAG